MKRLFVILSTFFLLLPQAKADNNVCNSTSFIWHYSSSGNKWFDYSLPEDNYGGITFDKGKITINQAQREIIHTNTLGANGLEITETSYPRYKKTFNPFEPVTIWIGNNYSFLGLSKDDENTQIVVPAMQAALYLQQIYNDNTQHTFRQVGNTVAITAALLAAPHSGGASLQAYAAAVSVGAGYVAAADAAMQEVKRQYVEDGSFAQYQDVFNKWDVFYAGAALLDGGVNVAAVAKSIDVVRLANNLKTTVRTATATTKTALRNNLIALYAHWIIEVKGLKNIDNLTAAERQLLTEQDEVFHVLGASQYSATGKALTWEEAVRLAGNSDIPFINGWTKESILAEVARRKTAGLGPLNPSEYLTAEYIAEHLAKFGEGASYLVPKEILNSRGKNLLGRPDGQFVIAKSDMDKLLNKANGNLSIIEQELGIPSGFWTNQELVRIDIINAKTLNIRIPTGNEIGANALWLPGGKLPTGYNEVVIDQIPLGQYAETIINIK